MKNSINIGELMMLTTLLGPRVICALQWKDFGVLDSYGTGFLRVYRSMSDDGKRIVPFGRPEMCRLYPAVL